MRRLALALLLCALAMPARAASPDAPWRPAAGTSFSIILSAAPAKVVTPAQAVDIDLFDTKASVVAALKKQGKHVICYFSAGSWENWRPDRARFPPSVRGNPLAGWQGELYLDIRSTAVWTEMKARLDLCKRKGFDGVDPDNIDSWQANTGFPLTKADAITYLRFLARAAHQRGLAIGLKNATEIAPQVLADMDFAVTEDCFKQGWCALFQNINAKNKPVFAIEYTDNHINFPNFCAQATTLGLSPLLKKRNLDTWERRCP